jgi:hypothetical protein
MVLPRTEEGAQRLDFSEQRLLNRLRKRGSHPTEVSAQLTGRDSRLLARSKGLPADLRYRLPYELDSNSLSRVTHVSLPACELPAFSVEQPVVCVRSTYLHAL